MIRIASGMLLMVWLLVVSQLQAQSTQPASPTVYDVRSFGATGDGKTLDSPAINKAIEAAAAKDGGTVFFSAGEKQ